MKHSGIVYLVGAGAGDPGLLTVRAAALLARADVVVYDALVNTDILRHAPKTAEVVYAGKRSSKHAIPQEELNQLLVKKAREGRTVVRLKGGDPYVFGRGGEEAEELVQAGIPFEVVPGISSAIAVPNYAGIPVTHRDACSSFMVITGHEDPTKTNSDLDWAAIAHAPGTKIILMGVERIQQITQQLIDNGMKPTTPVAMVRWGTTGRQQSIEGTLASIAKIAADQQFAAPAVTIVGDVVRYRQTLNWFENRPLFGQRVVVTRTREQASEFGRQLSELGAEVLEIPTIRIADPKNRQPVVEAIAGIGSYDWLVFTSPNGVAKFFEYFLAAYEDMRAIGNVRIAAVGPATAAKVKEFHLKVDAMPPEYIATKVAKAIHEFENVENLRLLLVRAETANPDLPKQLEDLGGIVDDIGFYQTVKETEDVSGAAERLTTDGAEWLTFTSSSTVENFHARFDLPALLKRFPHMRTASIGPETSKALKALGVEASLEATPHNIDGLVKGILKAHAEAAEAAGG